MTYKIGYARVSREGQTTEQQVAALRKEGCEEIFEETGSGANRARPKLAEALARCRKGDALVIWKLDRLARSTKHLIEIAEDLKARQIELISITDRIDTSTASGKLLFTVLGAIAEFERDVIVERVTAGLDRARAQGKIGGRPRVDQAKLDIAFAAIGRGASVSEAARKAEISRSTLNRAIAASKTSPERKDTADSLENSLDTPKSHLKLVKTAAA